MTPRVTVVVPTFGRPDLLLRCLAALDRQTLAREHYEVVVVADGPDERIRTAVEALDTTLFRFMALPAHRGPAAARNLGWRAARAPVVAFTDDDTVPDAGWLRAGLDAFDAHDCAAVTGRVVMPLTAVPSDYERDAARLSDGEFVTANCFVSVAALRAIGGFDERFTLAWREDSDLHFALLASGANVVAEPRAIVVHPVRPARWGVSVRQQRKVVFDALLFKKHPELYRSRIRRHVRADYYATVATLSAAVVAGTAGAVVVAGAAAAAWAALTTRFCLRRLANTRRDFAHVAEIVATSIVIPPLAVFWRCVGAARFRVVFL